MNPTTMIAIRYIESADLAGYCRGHSHQFHPSKLVIFDKNQALTLSETKVNSHQ